MAVQLKPTTRLEAFSDGVFAIAITLLIFNLKVPAVSTETVTNPLLRLAFLRQWPAYAAFLSSFLTILIIWMNHHDLFSLIRGIDRRFMFVNGLLLLVVTIIPYSTGVLAEYILTEAASTAALFFSGTYCLLSAAFNWLWFTARNRRLILDDVLESSRVKILRQGYWHGLVIYGVAVLLALFFPLASVGICTLMAVFYAFRSYQT